MFTDEVGRVLAFGGSRGNTPALDHANDVLRETVARLPDSALAVHAAAALSCTATVPGQILFEDPEDPHIKEFRTVAPDPEQALPLIEKAYGDPGAAADTLGHIGLTQQVEQVAIALAATGDRTTQEAVRLTNAVADTLDARNVLPSVVIGTGRLGKSAEQLTSRESTVGGHDTMPTVLSQAPAALTSSPRSPRS